MGFIWGSSGPQECSFPLLYSPLPLLVFRFTQIRGWESLSAPAPACPALPAPNLTHPRPPTPTERSTGGRKAPATSKQTASRAQLKVSSGAQWDTLKPTFRTIQNPGVGGHTRTLYRGAAIDSLNLTLCPLTLPSHFLWLLSRHPWSCVPASEVWPVWVHSHDCPSHQMTPPFEGCHPDAILGW